MGGPVYFPLIVGDRVFVVAGNMPGNPQPNYGSRLYALSLTDGHVIWGPIEVDQGSGYYFSGLTYDGGRLFVASGSGAIDAIDPNTGADLWPAPVPVNGIGINAQPTAVNGVVYVTSQGNGYGPPGPVDPSDASVTALRESDGHVLWVGGIDSGDWSAPAVTSSGVYVTNACWDTWDFDPATGRLIWHYDSGCHGGGGTTPSLWHGKVYAREDTLASGTLLDAFTGAVVGHFPSRLLPAFNGSFAYMVNGAGALIGWNIDTMTTSWTLNPPSGDWFATAPMFADGNLYIASRDGELIAANASNGAEVWSDSLGVALTGTNNEDNADETTGISIGNGWLLLPVNTGLVAYTSAASRLPRSSAPDASAVPFHQRGAVSPRTLRPSENRPGSSQTAVPETTDTRMSSLAGGLRPVPASTGELSTAEEGAGIQITHALLEFLE